MLETVEVRQLVQGIPIALTVLVDKALIWSEDNNIAVVTQLGTYIFELNISPDDSTPCIMFSRFFIPPPAQPNQYLDTGIKVDKILQHADHSTSHSIMFDCFLSAGERSKNECYPRASKSNSPAMPGGEVSHHGFSKGCWSPYGMSYEGGCLLALATYDHRLILFTQEGHKWEEVINLSTLWYKHVSSNSWKIVPVSKGASLHETYLARMQMLCLSELQWTPLFADCQEKFSVLIMITLSGHAVFWKVPSEVTSASEVQLLGTEETKMKFISSICWLTRESKSGYVVLGSSNGQAKIFYCTFSKELVMRDLGYVHANADRLRISHVMLLHISEKQHLLLLGKQSFLLAIALNLSENDLLLQSTIHTPLGRLPISGMICLKNNNLYLSMKDGNIQHVFLRVENGQVYAQHLGTHFHSEGVAYISLVKSPHSTLWAFLESVSVAYDHLVVREPTQISIYQVGSGAKIYDYLQEHPSPLHLCADILESLRLYSGKSGKCSLRFITPDKVDGLSEYHLKLCYWLVRMSRNIEESDSQNMESLRETERLLQKAILELWMNANISQISVSNVLDDSSLALSHFLMCDWIMNNGREKEKINAANVRRKFNKELQEQCPVCAEAVKMESLTSGTCPNGHTFPRCCRTFLMTKPMMMCPRCKSYTNKYARDLESGRVATCVYCDGRLKRLTGRRN
ncbi:hypothetical protein SK128_018141 [Halocaridina rubra]|uniref:Uncharacterized protein n=1 Tax=Halocaridina rubra TaxID=373956 RepID=A0AAN9ABP2_HALRR